MGALGGACALALEFALVYAGERYAIDPLAGAALAAAVHGAGHLLAGPALHALERLAAPGPKRSRLRLRR